MSVRLERTLAGSCWAALFLLFWSAAMWTPLHDWNGARFYPAYLLAGGEPLYAVAGEGVVNGWIYGPVLPLLLAPCTWITEPSWAMAAAAWCNIAFLFCPLLVVFNYALRDVAFGRRILVSAGAAGFFLLVPTTSGRLVFITADQLAIGLGVISCLLLHHAQRSGTPGRLALAGAALFGAAACWTKQTEALLPVAQLGFIFWRGGGRAALRYAGMMIGAQVGFALGFVAWFGVRPLWFNLAWIPSHHPLAAGHGNLSQRAAALALYTLPLAAVYLVARHKARACRPPEADVPALAEQLFVIGAGLLPFGLLAAAKNGGDENSFHSLYYFALAGLVLLVAGARRWPEPRFARWSARMGVGCLVAGVLLGQRDAPTRLSPAPQLQQALVIARAYPSRIVFPRNPLVTWLTERKKYHLEWGLYDQVMAGVPLRRDHFWRGMPPQFSRAAYPLPGKYFFMQLFPPVTQEARVFDFLTLYTFASPAVVAQTPR